MNNATSSSNSSSAIFENIKQINSSGSEFWRARELFELLGYTEYSKFLPAIERAMIACKASEQAVKLHFAHVSETNPSRNQYGSIKGREIDDYHLSRYACYLVAQNSDPRKEEVAHFRSYFSLRSSGFIDYEIAEDQGYRGLYGGLRQKDIHRKKGLKTHETILDHMGSEELAANLFRATQTEARIKRENVFGQGEANKTHHEVGRKVRKTIVELGGVMPERLSTPDGIKKAESRMKKNVTKKLAKKSPLKTKPALSKKKK